MTNKAQRCSAMLNTKTGFHVVKDMPYPPPATYEFKGKTYRLTDQRYPAFFWGRLEVDGCSEKITSEPAFVYNVEDTENPAPKIPIPEFTS